MQMKPIRTRDEAFYRNVPPVSLEVTSKCNLKCPYCANSTLTRPQAFIQWDLLEKIVDDAALNGHNISALHGTGEPLLWSRLEDVIRLIKGKGAGDASFATNGTLLTGHRIKKLLDAGMTELRVSLDSLDPDTYAATRGGSLKKVIKNILTLIKTVPSDFVVTIILMRHKDQKIDGEQIATFYRTFGFSKNVRLEIVENGLMVSSPEDYRINKNTVKRCSRPTEWFTVTSQGIVSICCSDQNAIGVIGDLRFQTICEVWYSHENQTTMSNIALGRGACPDVCTKHCWLEPPEADAGSSNFFNLSVDDGINAIKSLILDGKFNNTKEIFDLLAIREKENTELQYLQAVLEGAASVDFAPPSIVVPGQSNDLSVAIAEKDSLIKKHHDFAQKLLAELNEKGIKAETRWET